MERLGSGKMRGKAAWLGLGVYGSCRARGPDLGPCPPSLEVSGLLVGCSWIRLVGPMSAGPREVFSAS